jgi:hypothetical protein
VVVKREPAAPSLKVDRLLLRLITKSVGCGAGLKGGRTAPSLSGSLSPPGQALMSALLSFPKLADEDDEDQVGSFCGCGGNTSALLLFLLPMLEIFEFEHAEGYCNVHIHMYMCVRNNMYMYCKRHTDVASRME